MLLAELDELLVPDLPFIVVVVVEEHHRRPVVHRAFEVGPTFHFDELHAAVADGAFVAEAVGLLDDDFALHPGQVREGRPIFCRSVPVRTAAVASVRADAAPDETIAASLDERGDPLANPIVELVEHDVVSGRVVDRVHDRAA